MVRRSIRDGLPALRPDGLMDPGEVRAPILIGPAVHTGEADDDCDGDRRAGRPAGRRAGSVFAEIVANRDSSERREVREVTYRLSPAIGPGSRRHPEAVAMPCRRCRVGCSSSARSALPPCPPQVLPLLVVASQRRSSISAIPVRSRGTVGGETDPGPGKACRRGPGQSPPPPAWRGGLLAEIARNFRSADAGPAAG